MKILEDKDMGVRVIVLANGMANVQVLNKELNQDIPYWEQFYVIKFVELADGKVSAATLGKEPHDALLMVRAVALAADHRVKDDYAKLVRSAW